MKKYTVRVELHDARAEDYAELHSEMYKRGLAAHEKYVLVDI